MSMKAYRIWINRISTPGFLVLMVVLFLGCQAAFQLWLMPDFQAATGGMNIFDMQTGYSYSEARDMIFAYGESGVRVYHVIQIVDLLFPFTYGFLFSGVAARLLARAYPERPEAVNFSVLGFAAALFDLTENLAIARMLVLHPSPFRGWYRTAFAATLLKGLALSAVVLIILFALGRWLVVRKNRDGVKEKSSDSGKL